MYLLISAEIHTAKPDPESLILDVGNVQTETFACVEQNPDSKVRISDPLDITANPASKLSKGVGEALLYEPLDLGQKVAGLCLRRPRLEPSDVLESDKCVSLVAIRDEKAGNLAELVKLRCGRIDPDETDIVSLRRAVQDLERRKPSVAFDDDKGIRSILSNDDQRLVLEEAVVQVGLRKLLQYSLLIQESENLRLRLSLKSLRKPWILTVKQKPLEVNLLNCQHLRVNFIHSLRSCVGPDDEKVYAADHRSHSPGPQHSSTGPCRSS